MTSQTMIRQGEAGLSSRTVLVLNLLAAVSGLVALYAVLLWPGQDGAAALALFGTLALAFFQMAQTHRVPVPEEALVDFIVLGGIGLARSEAYRVWQIPNAWVDVLHVTSPGATFVAIVFAMVAVLSIVRQERHIGLIDAGAVLVVPLVFNLGFSLGADNLMSGLGQSLSMGHLAVPVYAAILGRTAVLLFCGCAVAGLLNFVRLGHILWERRFYGVMAIAAVAAAVTPVVADIPLMAAATPGALDILVAIFSAALAQAGIWAIVYLLTGLAMDTLRGKPPCFAAGYRHWKTGLLKGAVYGGVFIGLLLLIAAFLRRPDFVQYCVAHPSLTGAIAGALAFPLAQTLISSADETPPFFGRLLSAYRKPRNMLRGLVVGLGVSFALAGDLRHASGEMRFLVLFAIGAIAYAGVDFITDCSAVLTAPRRKLQTWRVYALAIPLGGIVAGALGWYFDANQLGVVVAKFWTYVDLDYAKTGRGSMRYVIYALFSKWGMMDLGLVAGGVKLFYLESVSGVINWAIAAPLFGVNYFLLAALVQRSFKPVKGLFSAKGLEGLVEQTIRVLRWGLWMAPVIYSFLRMSPEPQWYNQDGAVRTVAATIASFVMPESAFNAWSLSLFTGVLAYDWLRVVIWLDHMGLRVATLVNLSFVGGDRGDEAAARFVGHAAKTRFVPEGIRRFATWAPLLIPFYIPRGGDWDTAWGTAERINLQHLAMPGPIYSLTGAYMAFAVMALMLAIIITRHLRDVRPASLIPTHMPACFTAREQRFRLSNGLIGIDMSPDGRGFTRLHGVARGAGAIDLTRRPMDPLQVRGPFFYVHDHDSQARWSLAYQPLLRSGIDYAIDRPKRDTIRLMQSLEGLESQILTTLSPTESVVYRTVRLRDTTGEPRRLVLTSFEELACHETGAYVRDPDFNAMHVETVFSRAVPAIFSRNRLLRDKGKTEKAKRMSPEIMFHAVKPDAAAQLTAYEDSRIRFIGIGTVQHPSGLLPDNGRPLDDEGLLATFDPAASFRFEISLPANGSTEIVFVTGHSRTMPDAASLAAACVADASPDQAEASAAFDGEALQALFARRRMLEPGAALSADNWPFSFDDQRRTLNITGSTPRPWAHVMANPDGFGTMVSNDGEVYSFNGNARHNGLTPWASDPARTILAGQRIFVKDLSTGLLHVAGQSSNGIENLKIIYGLGTATFTTSSGDLDLELKIATVHDAPADLRVLTLRNRAPEARQFRVTTYLDMALDENTSESRGNLTTSRAHDNVLVFDNPKNNFRRGPTFVASSLEPVAVETTRARFIGGPGRDLGSAIMVESGAADPSKKDDGRRIASHVGIVEVPADGEVSITLVLGQTETVDYAVSLSQRLRQPEAAKARIAATEAWWLNRVSNVEVHTNDPGFDRLVNHWLPYQLLASRLWGRVGPNQRGGAIGFRDQLQDVLPLIFHDPQMVRAQILLHAGQQFIEGDVLKWWHPASDGRTLMGQRTRASDPHLWLPYALVRYVAATADHSIVTEEVPYIEGPALKPHQAVDLVMPRLSRDSDDVYGHCKRAIDYALSRMGPHGLPLVGAGDWNDGIDVAGLDMRGESVWMGFFLHDVLRDFSTLAIARNPKDAAYYRAAATKLAKSLDAGWQDGRYIIGFEDSGRPFGQASIMTAAWPILSGAVDFERGRAALEAGLDALEREDRILLLTPPFDDDSSPYPGRIADYPSGVRENGAQYTHGATWVVDAFVHLANLARACGETELAARLSSRAVSSWRKLSPLGKTEGAALAAYGLAPHQQPADIYDGPWHAGRGGWSWYTGSAARMLSAAYGMLGMSMVAGELWLPNELQQPCGTLQVHSLRVGKRRLEARASIGENA